VERRATAVLGSQVDAAKAGMEQLERAHGAVTSLRSTFAAIVELCAECDQLIEHQDKIQQLSTVNTNLLRIVQDVEVPSLAATHSKTALQPLSHFPHVDMVIHV
jgi:hypothetical protein